MTTLARLTLDETLAHRAQRWRMEGLSWADRAEIYTAFLLTKNLQRIKHRTWRQNRRMVQNLISRTRELSEGEQLAKSAELIKPGPDVSDGQSA